MNKTRQRSIVCAGVIFLALISSAARADKPAAYTPKIVPECKIYALASGYEICGYNQIGSVKKLYLADAELVAARTKIKLLEAKAARLTGMARQLSLAAEAQKAATRICKSHSKSITLKLIEKDRLLQNERARPRIGSTLAWGTASALALILSGVIVEKVLR